MTNIAKRFGISCALVAVLAPTVSLAADDFTCDQKLIARPNRQSCDGDLAQWIASAGAGATSLDVLRIDTTELNSISTQGYDSDQQIIGGCIAVRNSPGHDESDLCSRTIFFHETTENG